MKLNDDHMSQIVISVSQIILDSDCNNLIIEGISNITPCRILFSNEFMTRYRTFLCLFLTLILWIRPVGTAVRAEEPQTTAQQLEFFEKEVRPLLAEHCFECHSTKAKRVEAKLLLDSRSAHVKGGDSGAAIVPGKADESLLIEAVRYESYEMPPKGKLPEKDIETLVRWINIGAPWPKGSCPNRQQHRRRIRSGKAEIRILGLAADCKYRSSESCRHSLAAERHRPPHTCKS